MREDFENFNDDDDEWLSELEISDTDLENELSDWHAAQAQDLAETSYGQDGLDLKISTDAAVITARTAATPNMILRERGLRTRLTLRRPRSMMAWVRSSAPGPRCPDSGQPPARIGVVKSSSYSSSTKCPDCRASPGRDGACRGRGGVCRDGAGLGCAGLGWARSMPGRPRCGAPSWP